VVATRKRKKHREAGTKYTVRIVHQQILQEQQSEEERKNVI